MGATGQWIPWQDRQEWSQVIESITTAVAGLGGEVEHLREIARQIEDWYAELEDLLDNLGAITCCNCTTICCTMATVWYDLRDLLFLYLANNRLPPLQITRNADRTCVHLTPHGCCLNRRERPFICTWYICAAQKDALMRKQHGAGKEIFAFIAKLKSARKELENRFVDAVG
jgi:hypothetical protein